jgi:hypothetical protein
MPSKFTAFNPEAATAMGDALNAAWNSLTGAADYGGGTADWARELLAMRIIETAQAGERNVTRLHDDALAHLANLRIQKRA